MPNLLKTLFISLVVLVFTTPSLAQPANLSSTTPYGQALDSPGMNLDKFTLQNLDSLFDGATKRMVGYPKTKYDTQISLLDGLSIATNYLYSPPVNTATYLAHVYSRINPTPAAYAATGDGWDFISPTIKLWEVFRNVAYLFFIIMFVALGFMIMFRAKLNPQTVIGVQQALPRIIISLILVTFSYAIAGFVVDIAFLGNNLIQNIVTGTCTTIGSDCIVGGDVHWGDPAPGSPTPSVWPFDIITKFGGAGIFTQMADGLIEMLGVRIPSATTPPVSAASRFSGFFKFIIAMSVIGATFKIFFSLLTKYVTIIISTIFMPLGFLWGVIPGKQNTNMVLLKSLISSALAFPAVMLFLGLAYYFSDVTTSGAVGGTFLNLPPFYITKFSTAAGAGHGGAVLGSLIGIGFLMVTPTIPSAIDKALEAGSGAGAGTAEIGNIMKKLPIIGGLMG